MLMRETTAVDLVTIISLVTTGVVDLAATALTMRGDTAAALHAITTRVRRGMSGLVEIFVMMTLTMRGDNRNDYEEYNHRSLGSRGNQQAFTYHSNDYQSRNQDNGYNDRSSFQNEKNDDGYDQSQGRADDDKHRNDDNYQSNSNYRNGSGSNQDPSQSKSNDQHQQEEHHSSTITTRMIADRSTLFRIHSMTLNTTRARLNKALQLRLPVRNLLT